MRFIVPGPLALDTIVAFKLYLHDRTQLRTEILRPIETGPGIGLCDRARCRCGTDDLGRGDKPG